MEAPANRETIPLRPEAERPAQPTPAVHGFDVACILCGEREVGVGLDDVTVFCCESCGNDFRVEDVRSHIESWQAVLAWCNSAPMRNPR